MNEISNIPQCIGVIMDGNRRWAKKNGVMSAFGHKAGYEKLKEALTWAKEAKIKNVIVYAFSTENWARQKEEVGYLMDLLHFAVTKERELFMKEGVRLKCIGDLSRLSPILQKDIVETERATAGCTEVTLVLCVSYGGRNEILLAFKKMSVEKTVDEIAIMSEEDFGKELLTGRAGIPDPDLVIRTSGEMRLSGFLPWQTTYSELIFTNTLWPDVTKVEFFDILETFAKRKRNLGK